MIRSHPLIFTDKTGTQIRDLLRTIMNRWQRDWKDGEYLLPAIETTACPIDLEPQAWRKDAFGIVDQTICPTTTKSSFQDLSYFYLVQLTDGTAKWMRPKGKKLDDGWRAALIGYQSTVEKQMIICKKAIEEASNFISFPTDPYQ